MNNLKKRNGQGMTEYVIILAAVVALAVLLVSKFRAPVQANINDIGSRLSTQQGNGN